MSKTIRKKLDPYACVRRETPKSGWPIVHKKEFVRKWEKIKEDREVKEGLKEYFGDR
jgi:uncharacterized protein YcnI